MHKHGKGPKDVLVRKHAKWMRGRRIRIETSIRGAGHKLGFRRVPFQLDFGFERPGMAR